MLEGEEEIGVNVHNNESSDAADSDDELASLEDQIEDSVNETIVVNPNVEAFSEERVSIIDDHNSEGEGDIDDLHRLVKTHSVQHSRLTSTVESLQSKIKQLESKRLSGNKTSPARIRSKKTKKNKARAKKTKGNRKK